MRYYVTTIFFIVIAGCNTPVENKPVERMTGAPVGYSRTDLQKIKWIAGKWKGMDDDKPFYEIYEFLNDSTLRTISYEWDGKDSSKSFVDYLYWKNDAYYLGENQDWAVQSISDTAIKMLPNKSRIHNDITWLRRGTGWDAVLVAPKGTRTYHMQRFDPFEK